MYSIFVLMLQCFCFTSGGKFVKERVHLRTRRDTVADEYRKWPGGIVPYTFGFTAGYKEQQVFKQAIKEIEKVSCVRFVKRTTERDYVRIISSREGCFSTIGRDGGQQDLSLGDGCHTKGIALHETFHTLGFYHEHVRRDRDHHVFVDVSNAMEGAKRQFEKYKPGEAHTLGHPYDPDSIMHYSNRAFSKNGHKTITYRKDPSKKLGQRVKLSPIDIKQLNELYRCKNNTSNVKKPKKTRIEIDTCRDDPWVGFQCLFYRFSGGCYFYRERMRQACPKTCGFCRSTCFDTSQYCNYFVYHGYCTRSENVRKRCRKSCKICRIA